MLIFICNNIRMEQVMNNHDLVCHIYSFGYPKHRTYMNSIVNHFKYKNDTRYHNIECIIDDMTLYNDSQYFNYDINEFISNLLDRQKQIALLSQMIECHCCTRHCHNRPIKIKDTFCYHPTSEKKPIDNCMCHCRSIARHLWRCYKNNTAFNTYKDTPWFRSPTEIII